MSVRLLIGDGNRNICMGFSMLTRSVDGVDCMGTTSDYDELLALDAQHHAHIILLDNDLLEKAARPLRLANPGLKLILLNKSFEAVDLQELHMAGAVGHICPDASHDDIRRAIEATYSGQVFQTPGGCTRIAAPHPAIYLRLTKTELALLQVSPSEDPHSAAKNLGISEAAYELYGSSLIVKLGVTTLQEAHEAAQKHGLVA